MAERVRGGARLPCRACESRSVRTLKTRFASTRMETVRHMKCLDCGHSYRTVERLTDQVYSAASIAAARTSPSTQHNLKRGKAHKAVWRAVRDGTLARPVACSQCGRSVRTQAHHHDYDQPLVVQWLCKPCHDRVHQ